MARKHAALRRKLTLTATIYNPVRTTTAGQPVTSFATASYVNAPCLLWKATPDVDTTVVVEMESTAYGMLLDYNDESGVPYDILVGARIVVGGETYWVRTVNDPVEQHHHWELTLRWGAPGA